MLNWSAGLLREGEWLYLVGVHGEGIEAKQVLARVPAAAAAARLDFGEMEGAWVGVGKGRGMGVEGLGGGVLTVYGFNIQHPTVWARDPKAPGPRWIPNEAFMAVEPYYTLGAQTHTPNTRTGM